MHDQSKRNRAVCAGIELELAKTGAVESSIEDETQLRRADMDVLGKQIRQQREAASDDDDW
jgi:hypothetical protein